LTESKETRSKIEILVSHTKETWMAVKLIAQEDKLRAYPLHRGVFIQAAAPGQVNYTRQGI